MKLVEAYEEYSGAVRVIVKVRDFDITESEYMHVFDGCTDDTMQFYGPYTTTKFIDDNGIIQMNALNKAIWSYSGYKIESSFQGIKMLSSDATSETAALTRYGDYFRVIHTSMYKEWRTYLHKKERNKTLCS